MLIERNPVLEFLITAWAGIFGLGDVIVPPIHVVFHVAPLRAPVGTILALQPCVLLMQLGMRLHATLA